MAGMNVRDDVLNQIPKPKPSGKDLAYRAVAAVLGGPVDLTAMVMKPFGYGEEKPVLGSEWIGQQMQNVGLVSEARDPLQEFMASLLVPGGEGYGSAEDVQKALPGSLLKDQFAYEGDTMGHCVGGYCDAVMSGKSQVYTLRDKTGKPHVTIEVSPTRGTVPITPEMRAERSYLPPHATHFNPDTGEAAYELVPPSERIVQIKGAKNSAPKDEYVPFIQDFIRNGNFSDVGDLANAQMRKMPDGSYYTEKELERVLDEMAASPETRAKTSLNWLMKEVEKSPEAWNRIKPFLDSLKDQ